MRLLFPLIFLLVSSQLAFCDRDLETDQRFKAFQKKMSPSIGKRITVSGELKSGKLGLVLSFNGWQAYFYADARPNRDAKVDKEKSDTLNRLYNSKKRNITVTGILRYNGGSHYTDVTSTGIPEHFYFDVTEVKVDSAKPSP